MYGLNGEMNDNKSAADGEEDGEEKAKEEEEEKEEEKRRPEKKESGGADAMECGEKILLLVVPPLPFHYLVTFLYFLI